jgi:hypothetical protein
MRIPKNKALMFADIVKQTKEVGDYSQEDEELLNQFIDRATLCRDGDGVAL